MAVEHVVGHQRPSHLWVPEHASSSGPEAVELAAEAGLILDPWQELVLLGGMGERPDGQWTCFEVGVEVARQNGKGGVLEARELAGLYLLPEKLLIHSAHEFSTSLEAFRRLLDLIEGCSSLRRLVARVSRSHGEEGIELKDGSRIVYRTRTKGGARGLTGDLVVLDEAMNIPEGTLGALMPTMRARPNPQLWYTGSAVDQTEMDHGLVFSRVRKRGIQGGDPSLAWFGWEAVNPSTGMPFEHPEDVDTEASLDPAVWASANPALGTRISHEHMLKEWRSMAPRTFAVELLCVGDWPDPDPDAGRKVSADAWNACADPRSVPVGPVCFSFDVPPGRGSAVVASAGRNPDNRMHVEVVESRAGTEWVPERIAGLVERNATLAMTGRWPADAVGHLVVAGRVDSGAEAFARHLGVADRVAVRQDSVDAQSAGGVQSVALAQQAAQHDLVSVDRRAGAISTARFNGSMMVVAAKHPSIKHSSSASQWDTVGCMRCERLPRRDELCRRPATFIATDKRGTVEGYCTQHANYSGIQRRKSS